MNAADGIHVNRCHGQDPLAPFERHNLRHGSAATRRRPRGPDSRLVPRPRVSRLGGHGPGVPGRAHHALPSGGPQGAAARDGVPPGEDRPLRAGGEGGGLAQPPRDRDPVLHRGSRRDPLPHHGARRGRDPQQADPAARVRDGAAALARHRPLRRGERGPPPGRPAPGPQAREHHAGRGRAAQGARLRPRQAALRLPRGRRQDDPRDAVGDAGRAHRGDGGLHVPGAGAGPARGQPLRHLHPRHPPLRDGHGGAALPRQHQPVGPLLDPQGHPAPGERAARRHPQAARADDPEGAREAARGPLPVRERPAPRPRGPEARRGHGRGGPRHDRRPPAARRPGLGPAPLDAARRDRHVARGRGGDGRALLPRPAARHRGGRPALGGRLLLRQPLRRPAARLAAHRPDRHAGHEPVAVARPARAGHLPPLPAARRDRPPRRPHDVGPDRGVGGAQGAGHDRPRRQLRARRVADPHPGDPAGPEERRGPGLRAGRGRRRGGALRARGRADRPPAQAARDAVDGERRARSGTPPGRRRSSRRSPRPRSRRGRPTPRAAASTTAGRRRRRRRTSRRRSRPTRASRWPSPSSRSSTATSATSTRRARTRRRRSTRPGTSRPASASTSRDATTRSTRPRSTRRSWPTRRRWTARPTTPRRGTTWPSSFSSCGATRRPSCTSRSCAGGA